MMLKKDGRFVNPHVEDDRRTFMDVIRWKTGFFKDPVQTDRAQIFFLSDAEALV